MNQKNVVLICMLWSETAGGNTDITTYTVYAKFSNKPHQNEATFMVSVLLKLQFNKGHAAIKRY